MNTLTQPELRAAIWTLHQSRIILDQVRNLIAIRVHLLELHEVGGLLVDLPRLQTADDHGVRGLRLLQLEG
jgi:hypothetical protein